MILPLTEAELLGFVSIAQGALVGAFFFFIWGLLAISVYYFPVILCRLGFHDYRTTLAINRGDTWEVDEKCHRCPATRHGYNKHPRFR